MFIGRAKELKKLNQLYQNNQFECAIIYGRRRVGKTTLINKFIKDKKAIYFVGLETNAKENLENFSRSILSSTLDNIEYTPVFENYQRAFDYLYDLAKDERIILVIDEYPYLASSYKPISSMLQIQIDQKFKNSKLFLILCGSSMSFMENQVLGYKSPLYGRRTAQFKINPFDYFETKEYFSNFNIYDMAVIYGITGGIPQYLTKISDEKTLADNIKTNFLDTSAYMFEEPLNLIKQELREPGQYNAIIKAIATGSSRLNEISTKTALETGLCSNYISSLISLGIVKKEFPIGEKSSKKTIYKFSDSMFRFWYKFIPENASQIHKGLQDRVYSRIEQQISSYMGEVFEDICKQYMWKENIENRLPVNFIDIGRWWGNNPKEKKQEEIDILAYNENDAIFAECKWTNDSVDLDVLNDLKEQSSLFYYKNVYFYLFAKTTFAKNCISESKNIKANNRIKLITFEDMNK
jgi:uncharacterized protein